MGLLENAGSPISWDDKRRPEANKYVMEHGIKQFINMYRKHCATSSLSSNKEFLWGDELEFILAHRPNGDTAQRQNRLSLCGDKILSEINDLPQDSVEGKWLPEYGSFMIECTPKMPYHATAVALAQVQDNMQRRYNFLVAHGRPHDVIPLPMTMYPLMGVGAFTEPGVDSESLPLTNSISRSLFVPDACINAHPRFGTLTKNIRLRRGQKVCIQVPILLDDRTQVDPILNIDVSTMNRWIEDDLLAQRNRVVIAHSAASERTDKRQRDENESEDVAGQQAGCKNVPQNFTEYFFPQYYQNHSGVRKRYESFQQGNAYHHPCVYMDCMAFGMGCCCLQVTMQLQDMNEARHVYDQLAIVSPIFLALTAATAVQKGILTDNDVRWVTVSGSVDDRTDEEVPKIVKSRYDSISTFVGQRVDVTRFNDCNMEINDLYLKELLDAGLDPLLARHIAHLFIREPLVIYDGKLETVDDLTMSDHFENIQSTNWQTVRLKPPPADGYHIGWRVEFRIMEISPSMFENAAYSVFIILLARAILKYNLCMYVPLSVVEMNMAHAHRRDATRERRFHFRENITQRLDAEQIAVRRMLIGEIINGFEVISNGEHNEDTRSDDFKGLAHYVERYVDEMEHEDTTKDTSGSDQYKLERANAYARIRKYIAFVRKKASGEIPSVASYIRTLVRSHPTYKNDSRVNDDITKEIIDCVYNMALGKADCPSLIPEQFHFVKK